VTHKTAFSPLVSRSGLRLVVLCALAALTLAVGGCKSFRHRDDSSASPESMAKQAQKYLNEGSYGAAVKTYEALTARYPFSDPAKQARLDLIYAYYKQHEKESAIDAADSFIRENPTHSRLDYAYYMKGLVYFERDLNFLERWLKVDISERPPQDLSKSLEAFQHVVQQYPQSEYAADAHQRMVYIRNRLADYNIHVARYYVKRGAWVAALARSREVLETYEGSPRTRDALEISAQCYDRLGMKDLAADSRKVLAANFAGAETASEKKKHWWKPF
jgi:outer membrane protein assembly factor BamD